MIDWRAFGDQLLLARRRRNITQRDLAVQSEVSRNYINMLERATIKSPGYEPVERICAVMRIKLPRSAQDSVKE